MNDGLPVGIAQSSLHLRNFGWHLRAETHPNCRPRHVPCILEKKFAQPAAMLEQIASFKPDRNFRDGGGREKREKLEGMG